MTIIFENGEREALNGFENHKNAWYLENYQPLMSICSTYFDYDFATSDFIRNIVTEFDTNCKGNDNCNLTFYLKTLPKLCQSEILSRAKSNQFQNLVTAMQLNGH